MKKDGHHQVVIVPLQDGGFVVRFEKSNQMVSDYEGALSTIDEVLDLLRDNLTR